MKNLVAKAGVAAVTSVLLTSVVSVPEAKALNLVPAELGTLAFGSRDGVSDPELRKLNITDPTFLDAGVVEVGEFLNNETRGYFEYDLSSLLPLFPGNEDLLAPSASFSIDLGVFSDGGTGSAGSAGSGSNLNNPFNGLVKVSWYVGTALNPLSFNPQPGVTPCAEDFGTGPCVNPLAILDLSSSDLDVGKTTTIDVTSIAQNLLLAAEFDGPSPYFGIILQVENFAQVGQCAGSTGRDCQGVTFTSGLKAVPTPAAILPSLMGLASAAFRKKKKNEVEA